MKFSLRFTLCSFIRTPSCHHAAPIVMLPIFLSPIPPSTSFFSFTQESTAFWDASCTLWEAASIIIQLLHLQSIHPKQLLIFLKTMFVVMGTIDAGLLCQRFISLMQSNQPPLFQTQDQRKQRTLQCQIILDQRAERYLSTKDKQNYVLTKMDDYYGKKWYNQIKLSQLNKHSVLPNNDQDRIRLNKIFQEMKDKRNSQPVLDEIPSSNVSRQIAAILGMAIGDALGACTEFMKFKKERFQIIKHGFVDIHNAVMQGKLESRHGFVGVWTDDASMGLCMADSILLNNYLFNPKHIRHTFIAWLHHGLNNGGRPRSIGLGGNISISMDEFLDQQQDYTAEGDRFNNGNGSLMRLAPVPIAYSNNPQKAILYSGLQSLTTHNGTEALECCRLMATIIVQLVNRKEDVDGKELLLQICDNFKTENIGVRFLARGQRQPQEYYNQLAENKKFKKFNKSTNDRNWNWRDQNHTYSPCRFKQQPGYIGSYCMDALAMALHTVHFTKCFTEAVTWNADMGGDCDTVGAIAAQIAGAIYGVDRGMLQLYSEMDDYKNGRYDVFLKAYKLAAKKGIE